jgi:hypothetical protein
VSLGLFGPHVLGKGTFIGDADRLNTFLNIRKFSVDSARELGRVPSWNDRMFLGFGTCGLHWMLPEADPFAYLGALVPQESLFWITGLVSCLFVIVAAWAFYALAYDTCAAPFPSFVGAALYVLSSFSINRICQVDWAFAVLLGAPLGLLILRRVRAYNAARSFLGLTALAAFLLVMTFLQEVAYVFFLLGVYACHRSLATRSWRPLVVAAAALLTASLFALPRLYTVFEDIRELDRSKSFQRTTWPEVFRWFDEGLFGRYPQEAQRIENGINLHEGVQFHSSIFAALLVVAGAVRLRRWREAVAGLALFGVLGWVFWTAGPFLETGLSLLGLIGLLGCVRAWAVRRTVGRLEYSDLSFHLLFLAFALAVILLTPVRTLVYRAFFSMDFTHSRITAAALPSLSLLITIFLHELLASEEAEASFRQRGKLLAAGAVTAVCLLVLLKALVNPLCRLLGYGNVTRVPWSINLLPSELVSSIEGLVLFGLLLGVYCACRSGGIGRRWIACSLGCLMVGSAAYAACFQLAGPHTWSYPAPFKDNNYFMAPGITLRPPTSGEKRQVQERLETDRFRTAVVASPQKYFAFVEPHLAEFWGIRLTGGYSAGVPQRLAALPWPGQVRQLRSLTFAAEQDVPWALLALLNTKYLVVLDDPFYYNLEPEGHGQGGAAGLKIGRVVTNPLPIVPRHFFTRSVKSVSSLQALQERAQRVGAATCAHKEGEGGAKLPVPHLCVTVRSPSAVMVHWNYPWGDDVEFAIERREGRDGPFAAAGTVPGSGRSFWNGNLQPGREYAFRIRARRGQEVSTYSEVAEAKTACAEVPVPGQLAVRRTCPGEAVVSWEAHPDLACIVEQADGATGNFVRVATAPAGASSYKAVGLGAGAYGFRVRASGARGTSVHSNSVWAPAIGPVEDETFRKLKAMLPDDPRRLSLVEGFPGSDAQTTPFDDSGNIRANYEGDRITLQVTPSQQPRFLVLNELYHPRWRAFVDGKEALIYPTNICMRGVVVPPGATEIRFEFCPFLHRPAALAIMAGVLLLILLVWFQFSRLSRRAVAAAD